MPEVYLLVAIGNSDGIELAHRIVAAQDATRILPGNRRAGLDLGPRHLGIVTAAIGPLGHEVVDAALAVLVAGIPVLHGGVLDFGVIHGNQFNHGCMQLVFIAHRSGTTFQI